jgi:cytochrome c5
MKLICVAMFAASALAASAADKVDESKLPPVAAKTGVTFEKDIKPLFEKSCVKCHGPEKQKAKLRVDTLEWLNKGSYGDPIYTKGKSAESLLVHVIAGVDPDAIMPPDGQGERLTKEQIGLVRAWIDQGAK